MEDEGCFRSGNRQMCSRQVRGATDGAPKYGAAIRIGCMVARGDSDRRISAAWRATARLGFKYCASGMLPHGGCILLCGFAPRSRTRSNVLGPLRIFIPGIRSFQRCLDVLRELAESAGSGVPGLAISLHLL